MLIIPAIDVIDNKVVRLTKGDFENIKNYEVSIIEQVERYVEAGFHRIHIVDLNASKDSKISTINLLKEIKRRFQIGIEFGGGIRNMEDVQKLFDTAIDNLIIGSLSVTDKNLFEKIIAEFKPENFIIAADVLNYSIMIKGWTVDSGINIFEHIEYCKSLGLKNVLCTDIEKDGMMKGVSFNLYNELKTKYPELFLIASGGVSNIDDVTLLKKYNVDACVVGKAIYEGKIDLKELKKFDN
ncbi:MAG: 1-(5-phosphoribosyl)-5-[(5-phosphoribosylamino) methylideneamino]imidazole-4-carboxamide isomerase [Ignavibacteriales bacterium]